MAYCIRMRRHAPFALASRRLQCFEMLALIRGTRPFPIGLLVYANLVFNNGIDGSMPVEQVGVDSMLVADVPV